ncbi:MAG TPA: diadenylate cyclase CdaA [Acidobacteriota bacterium]|nr:diadenylate cyclase CdaA [Acidobacteriota bacterium]
MNTFRYLIFQLNWYDLLDILLVTTIVVWLYSWVKGTRAFRVLLGLGLVIVIYLWARAWNLFLTEWVFQGVVQVLIIFVIIIFAPEIRQVLERLNPLRIWNRPTARESLDYIDEIVSAITQMAKNHIGALIVFQRDDRLDDIVRPGIPLDGEVKQEILLSLFQPSAPTHDGAAWIKNGLIHQIGAFLPISQGDHPNFYGSRHRAALGISEVSDALVLVSSEERGRISLVEDGRLQVIDDPDGLHSILRTRLEASSQVKGPDFKDILFHEWKIKLSTFAIVTAVWFAMAGQQQIEQIYSVDVQLFNLPSDYTVTMPVNSVLVTLTGTRLALARLDPDAVKVRIDLSQINEQTQSITISPDRILKPPDVFVSRVDPQVLTVEVDRAEQSQSSRAQ